MSTTFLVLDAQKRTVTRPATEDEFKVLVANNNNVFGFRINYLEKKKPFPYELARWRDIEGYNWQGHGTQETLVLAEARCMITAYTDHTNEALTMANWLVGEYNKLATEQKLHPIHK